jgi:hypothetical protein
MQGLSQCARDSAASTERRCRVRLKLTVSEVATLFAALIGAVVGSVGAVVVEHQLSARTRERERRRMLIRQDLFQLQDSMESVRRRLLNLLEHSGASVMTERYRQVTTLYAFAVVLAIERKFAREAVYFELNDYWTGLGDLLRGKRFDAALRGLGIHHYRRIALADVASERDGDRYRVRSLLEFITAYEQLKPDDRDEFVTPFLAQIERGDRSQLRSLIRSLLGGGGPSCQGHRRGTAPADASVGWGPSSSEGDVA